MKIFICKVYHFQIDLAKKKKHSIASWSVVNYKYKVIN